MPAAKRRRRSRRRARPPAAPPRPPRPLPQPLEPGMQGSEVELALDRKLLAKGWYFSEKQAQRICLFFERVVTHSKGEWAGKHVSLAPWQRQKLRRLFGWRRPDGTRRYRRTQWWIPKKNGKSLIAAGIALYLTGFDGEPGAEVYSAAGNKEQASLVFDEAKKMVGASSELQAHLECFNTAILKPQGLSAYKVLSAKPGTKHGFNVHGLVVDEVHEFKSRDLYDFLASGTGARRQPLEVVISTAGADIGSFGYELYEYAKKLHTGVLEDPECMVVIFEAGADDPWDDEKTWAKANPNLGVSPKLEFLRGEVVKCRGMPGMIPTFKRLYLNIWTQSAKAWLDLNAWRACPRCPVALWPYRRRRCWGALDLSKTTDLSSLVLVFEREGEDLFDVLPFFWCPADHAETRARTDMATYPLWIQQRFLRATPGNIVDYKAIRRDIQRLSRIVEIQEIAYDRWSATQLVQDLKDEDGMTMVEFGQGYASMNTPACELERRVMGALIALPDHPVLTWNASNVVVRRDPAGNIKPDKEKSRHRIDGIVALVMALGRATLGRGQTSVYEARGLLSL